MSPHATSALIGTLMMIGFITAGVLIYAAYARMKGWEDR